MQIQKALTLFTQSPDMTGLFLVRLQGLEQPSTFLAHFFERIQELNPDVTFLDTAVSSLNECKAQLEISFLGMKRIYVLKNTVSLDAASKREWQSYLAAYKGPHTLFFFESLGKPTRGKKTAPISSPESSPEGHMTVELPEMVETALYKELFSFFFPLVPYDPGFARSLFSRNASVSLDDACRLMGYHLVVGRNTVPFFDKWYPKLVLPEASLFTLSQCLLGKSTQQFFRQWKACKDDYPPEFWIAYWSDQLWQAALFVRKARMYGLAEAKNGYYKLPFKFMSSDWQRYTPQLLISAHNKLYELDYALKNGADEYGLELWYHRFLTAVP
jgi:hypothetical protein